MKTFLKVLKGVLYVLGIASIIAFIVFFIKGIYASCVADDIITQQNRIESAYFFLYMICFGVGSLIFLIPTISIKENVVPELWVNKVKNIFKKK